MSLELKDTVTKLAVRNGELKTVKEHLNEITNPSPAGRNVFLEDVIVPGFALAVKEQQFEIANYFLELATNDAEKLISSAVFEGDSLRKIAILNHVTEAAEPKFSRPYATFSGFTFNADLTPYQEEMKKFKELHKSLLEKFNQLDFETPDEENKKAANAVIATLLTKNNLELTSEITRMELAETVIEKRSVRHPHSFPPKDVLLASIRRDKNKDVKFSYLSEPQNLILQKELEVFFGFQPDATFSPTSSSAHPGQRDQTNTSRSN